MTATDGRRRFSECRSLLQAAWAYHFAASMAILAMGIVHYETDRKYIPIDPTSIGDDPSSCVKAYANVLASSMDDHGAIVCCTPEPTNNQGICHSPSSFLLVLARKLTKLRESILLPLVPVLIRWLFLLVSKRHPTTTAAATSATETVSKRLGLYLGVIVLRVSILYLLLDTIEGYLVTPSESGCWYDHLLKQHQDTCYGTTFDYSDHIVLFFAQILPIALTEVVVSFVSPYWNNTRKIVPTILVGGLFYLYLVTFLAAYKTAAYFHTQLEIIVGYAISLLVQIPLFLVTSTSHMEPIRDYFFSDIGSTSSDHDKKP